MTGNPLFDSLAVALKDIDAIPIHSPYDGRCRSKNSSNSARCRNMSGTADEMDEVQELRSDFESMTQMPDMNQHYDNIKKFVGLLHCRMARHRDKAMEAFKSWDRQPVSGSRPTTVAPSEASEEVDHEYSITTASSFTSQEVIESTPRTSPEPPEVVDKLKDLAINTPVESSPRGIREQSEVADQLESLTITTAIRSTLVQLNDESLNLTEETVTTANNTVVEVDDSSTGQTEKVFTTSVQVTSVANITGLDSANFQRAGSVRNAGPIFNHLYEHPTQSKMAEGILYILESIEYPGHFKICCVTQSQNYRNNCHGSNTKPIHETQGGKFKGALQAKHLAAVILRQHIIAMNKCATCGKSHQGWFRAPVEVVRNAVLCMEIFIKMPAYTNVDGEWKLTSAAHNILKEFCSFSVEKLEDRIAVNKNMAQDVSDETTAPAARIAGPLEAVVSEEDEKSDENGADESLLSQTEPGLVVSPSRRRTGRILVKAAVKVVKGKNKVKDIWRNPWGRDKDGPVIDLTIALDRLKEKITEFKKEVNQEVEGRPWSKDDDVSGSWFK